MPSPCIHPFLHFPRGFVEVGSRDVRFLMPFTGEIVCRGVFPSVSQGYGVGGHGLESHDDLKQTLARSLTSLQVIRKLGDVE